jgi:hypothetical protein
MWALCRGKGKVKIYEHKILSIPRGRGQSTPNPDIKKFNFKKVFIMENIFNEFISVYSALPGLCMLCDVKLKGGNEKKARLTSVDKNAYCLTWVGGEPWEMVEASGLGRINSPDLITHWRYNKEASKDEVIAWADSLKPTVNKDEKPDKSVVPPEPDVVGCG